MTAGLWSLETLSPRLYEHLAKLGAQLAAGLADAARDAGVPLQVNAFGSLLTPFFTRPAGARLPVRADAPTPSAYGAFFRGMLARGVYPPPSQFEAWFLSAAHTDKDVERTISAERATCRASRSEGPDVAR